METVTRARIRIHREDGPLGAWMVALCRPHPALAELVANYWYGEGRVSYARDRILPSGQAHLLINLGPTQYRIEPGPPERRVPFRDTWLSGLHQTPIDTEAPHGNRLFGVAFHAPGAWACLGGDAHEVADRIVPLADALGDRVASLRERLLEMREPAERFAAVESWLLARLSPRRAVHPAVRHALARLVATRGRVPVTLLARETGFTRKHLAALFLRQTGHTPKTHARIQRFRAATALLGGADRPSWSELADVCGYYDQSHLIRDFREFSGFAPGDFADCAQPDGTSIVIR
jgi:AraC-like DNA-binding protein